MGAEATKRQEARIEAKFTSVSRRSHEELGAGQRLIKEAGNSLGLGRG